MVNRRVRRTKAQARATMFGCGLMIVTFLLVVAACNAVFGGDEPAATPQPAATTHTPTPTPTPEASDPVDDDDGDDQADLPDPDGNGGGRIYYDTCADARRAGDAPLYAGDPGYRPALDRDKDGDACE